MYLVCSEINRKSAQQSVVCYEIIVTSSKQAEGKLHLKKIAKKRSVVPLRWCLGMQIDLTREGAHRRSLFGCFLFQVKAHVILSVMRRIIKWEEDKCPIEVFLPMRVHLLCTSPRSCTLTTLSEAKQAFITLKTPIGNKICILKLRSASLCYSYMAALSSGDHFHIKGGTTRNCTPHTNRKLSYIPFT